MKYDKSGIFKEAWRIVKKFSFGLGAALKLSWMKVKKAIQASVFVSTERKVNSYKEAMNMAKKAYAELGGALTW